MILRAPETVVAPLYEGPLTAEAVEAPTARGPADEVARELEGLPVISVGRPETWPVSSLLGDSIPVALKAKLTEADFYLVRFAFSIRLHRKDRRVDWVRFSADLLPGDAGQQPLVFDLHPRQENREVKHDVKVSLSPSVKFSEVEISAGEMDYQVEYGELIPMISGSGIGEASASWDFESVRGVHISGVRTMHMLISSQRGTPAAAASMRIAANVVGPGFQIPVFLRRERSETDSLTAALWTEAAR